MKEIFTEEEYNEAIKKYNEEITQDFYNDLSNYISNEDYEDLRNYELTENEFKILWRCQDLLSNYDLLKQDLSQDCINIFEKLKEEYCNSFKGE